MKSTLQVWEDGSRDYFVQNVHQYLEDIYSECDGKAQNIIVWIEFCLKKHNILSFSFLSEMFSKFCIFIRGRFLVS
jgi:hypothetical protein